MNLTNTFLNKLTKKYFLKTPPKAGFYFNMEQNKILGQRGEDLAAKYLLATGQKIIEKNYRSGYQEIDIIATKNHRYIFVEVKTRQASEAAIQDNPLSAWQTKNLKRAIKEYLITRHVSLELAQLDLIVIIVKEEIGIAQLKHYPDLLSW